MAFIASIARVAVLALGLGACGSKADESNPSIHAREVITELCEKFERCLAEDPTLLYSKYESVERCVSLILADIDADAPQCYEPQLQHMECRSSLECENYGAEECADEYEATFTCREME